jgi:hypothetical protein
VKFLLLLPLMALTACMGGARVAPEPIVVVKEVKVPVAAGCVPSNYVFADPDYVDTDNALRAAADAAERLQLLWGGRAQRIARDREKEIVVRGCPRADER